MIQINHSGAIGSPTLIKLEGVAAPISIAVHPASGQTALVEYSISPGASGNPGSAKWLAWPSGSVSASKDDVRLGPLAALRITGAGSYEVLA